jgi:hypothetical protein
MSDTSVFRKGDMLKDHNAPSPKARKVYGLLASYDDETYTSFWHELEIGVDGERRVPDSANLQTLVGPRKAPPVMVKMLRKQLASVHSCSKP